MIRNVTLIILSIALWAAAQTPPAPVLAYPADGAKDVSVYATLKWRKTAGAATYHVQIATDLGFTAFFLEDSAVADTSLKMNKFADSTNYYWRVRARSAAGYGPFSKTRLLTSQPPLEFGPILSSPPDYAGEIPTTVELAWEAFQGATGYHVQVSKLTNFGTIEIEDTVPGTALKVGPLLESTEYFWHVRALGPGFPGQKTAWTKARFLTAGAVGVRTGAGEARPTFAVRPLPGRGAEAVITLAAPAMVALEVFDWSGRLVDSRAAGYLSTGTYRLPLPAGGTMGGVYFVRLVVEGRALSQRVALP